MGVCDSVSSVLLNNVVKSGLLSLFSWQMMHVNYSVARWVHILNGFFGCCDGL